MTYSCLPAWEIMALPIFKFAATKKQTFPHKWEIARPFQNILYIWSDPEIMQTASRSHMKSGEWEYLRNFANILIFKARPLISSMEDGTCRLSTVRPIKYLNSRFSKSLLRYGMICCARPRLKEAEYVVCILCIVNNTKYCLQRRRK